MDKENSVFDFDNDPDFSANFSKNIEKVLSDAEDVKAEPEKIEITDIDVPEELVNSADEHQDTEEADTVEPSLEVVEDSKTEVEEDNTDIEDELSVINESLAQQISNEMNQESITVKKLLKKKRLFKIQSGILLTLLCLVGFAFFFGFTKPGNALLMRLGVNISGTIWGSMTNKFDDSTDVSEDVDYIDDDDLSSDAPEIDPSTIVWPDHPGYGRQEEGVYNILLLGEEAINMGDSRGHTDVLVIATLNTKDKSVKLTSLMRDTLVQIPGYQDNKLNSVYAKGGLDLLYETIAINFDLRIDGCVLVDFDNFEKIIDDIGGVELTLKQNEADYLNTTNYVSNPKYRTLVAGKQLMNGNQVLGYARVRKTSTITGKNNDYGRTDRHRAVLNAIFEKCKTMSKTDLLALMFKFLPMITTDINSKCFQSMLNSFIDNGMSTNTIEQLRIPADGAFQDNIKVRKMSVLVPDLEANIKILHSFIFGEEIVTGSAVQTDGGTNTGTGTNAE
jgi:polyisoprenyl-teichoic acid--peptidoglycan teichoic acid transferase